MVAFKWAAAPEKEHASPGEDSSIGELGCGVVDLLSAATPRACRHEASRAAFASWIASGHCLENWAAPAEGSGEVDPVA